MKATVFLLPKHQRQLKQLDANLKLARLRRKLTTQLVIDRAGIGRATLNKIENGDPDVARGSYCQVMRVLGLEG